MKIKWSILSTLILLYSISINASDIIFDNNDIYSYINSNHGKSVYISDIVSSNQTVLRIIETGSDIIVPFSSFYKSYSKHCTLIENNINLYAVDRTVPFSLILCKDQFLMGDFTLCDREYLGNSFMIISGSDEMLTLLKQYADSLKQNAVQVNDIGSVDRQQIHSEPAQFVNKMITLRGTIDNIREISGSQMFLLNMQDTVNPVTIVIFNDIAESIIASGINPQYFLNREISVKGVLIDHPRYGYEIILNSPDNIAIID